MIIFLKMYETEGFHHHCITLRGNIVLVSLLIVLHSTSMNWQVGTLAYPLLRIFYEYYEKKIHMLVSEYLIIIH